MNRHYMLLVIVIITLTLISYIEANENNKSKGCTGGQRWTLCKGCNATCDPRPVLCPAVCLAGCKCPPHKPIWHNGQCIMKKKCPKCEGGQVYSDCASACDRTCDVPYPLCTKQCVQRCACPLENPILHNGVCIHEKECPCPPGQVYNLCGSACNSTCDDPYPICTEQCVPRCECPSDKPIIDNEQCIEHKDCFDCPGGQVFDTCVLPESCWPSCENPGGIPCRAACRPGCKCPSSKPIWHNGQCISEKDCDDGCTGGTIWKDCGSSCNKTCDNPSPICTKECVPRCECPSDKPIIQNGVCIEQEDCCTGGQVWNECGSACNSTCVEPSPPCVDVCVPRCECPREKPIIHNGQCIEQNDCCPGGQVWNECGSSCTKTCSNPNPLCTRECVPRCECPLEIPIWLNYQCVEASECPVCMGGQEWSECGTFCNKTCEKPNPVCPQFFACMGGCDCPADKPIMHHNKCVSEKTCPQNN